MGLALSGSRLIWAWIILDPEQDLIFSISFLLLHDILDSYIDESGFDSYLALLLSHICLDLSGSRLIQNWIILDLEQDHTFLSVLDLGMIFWAITCLFRQLHEWYFHNAIWLYVHFQDPD